MNGAKKPRSGERRLISRPFSQNRGQNIEEKQERPNGERAEIDRSFRDLYEKDRQDTRRRKSNQIYKPQRESAAH